MGWGGVDRVVGGGCHVTFSAVNERSMGFCNNWNNMFKRGVNPEFLKFIDSLTFEFLP